MSTAQLKRKAISKQRAISRKNAKARKERFGTSRATIYNRKK